MANDKHIIEAVGKAKVTIENGEVTSVEEPIVTYCPIFNKHRGMKELTPESIKKNVEFRIKDFGMCTKDRKVKLDDALTVGISEILRSNRKLGNIDCVVGACEGVGTLLMTDPDIIQGVGGRVSGLVSTTPIKEVIEKVGEGNVLDPETAELNPIKGLQMAIDRGYKNIAVTILPSPMIKEIRECKKPNDVNVYIFVAHTTDITLEETKEAFEYADIVTACASKNIREYAHEAKPYYYGTSVPIYAASKKGRYFLDCRLKDINKPPSTNKYPQDDADLPNPLI